MNFLQQSIQNLHDLKHIIDIDDDLIDRTEARIAHTYQYNKYMNITSYVEMCLDYAIEQRDLQRQREQALTFHQRQQNYDRLIDHNRRREQHNRAHPERPRLAPLNFVDHMLRLAGFTRARQALQELKGDNVTSIQEHKKNVA